MANRVSSLDNGYTSGDLSLFPDAIDDRAQLYQAANNAKAVLKFGLPFHGKKIIVDDASGFPTQGLLRISADDQGTSELVYYGSRTDTVFSDLVRGFAGSQQTAWSSGVYASNSVMAEHHNAIKDALLKLEQYIGVKTNPDRESLHGIVIRLEDRFLAPKAQFRAFPRKGPPALKVRFQNISAGHTIRYLWDFGDGTRSIEKNPSHTYQAEGYYTVRLTIYTSAGGQGITVKNNYIKVSEEERSPFFYVVQQDPSSPAYSTTTATMLGKTAAVFNFVDQTDGDIARRIWVFGDGTTYEANDPDEHATTHIYESMDEYNPTLLIVYSDQTIKRANLNDPIVVL